MITELNRDKLINNLKLSRIDDLFNIELANRVMNKIEINLPMKVMNAPAVMANNCSILARSIKIGIGLNMLECIDLTCNFIESYLNKHKDYIGIFYPYIISHAYYRYNGLLEIDGYYLITRFGYKPIEYCSML